MGLINLATIHLMTAQPHTVLLYYKYVPLTDPNAVRQWQYDLCAELDINGRILVAEEGINGTVAGTPEAIEEYKRRTESREEFSDLEWKESEADEQVFPRLSVKEREEVVTLGLKSERYNPDKNDVALDNKAHYIEPEELLRLYEEDEDFVILDARNEYEAKVGKFKDALVPPIDNFREFPRFAAEQLQEYKDKTVVTYCTGGIRCEKASAYLREQGFENVRQLHGGVHRYAEHTGGKYFEGRLFVFDKRLLMDVNDVNPSVISDCKHCGTAVARYIDCANERCNALFVCCAVCEQRQYATCSSSCRSLVSR